MPLSGTIARMYSRSWSYLPVAGATGSPGVISTFAAPTRNGPASADTVAQNSAAAIAIKLSVSLLIVRASRYLNNNCAKSASEWRQTLHSCTPG